VPSPHSPHAPRVPPTHPGGRVCSEVRAVGLSIRRLDPQPFPDQSVPEGAVLDHVAILVRSLDASYPFLAAYGLLPEGVRRYPGAGKARSRSAPHRSLRCLAPRVCPIASSGRLAGSSLQLPRRRFSRRSLALPNGCSGPDRSACAAGSRCWPEHRRSSHQRRGTAACGDFAGATRCAALPRDPAVRAGVSFAFGPPSESERSTRAKPRRTPE